MKRPTLMTVVPIVTAAALGLVGRSSTAQAHCNQGWADTPL